MRILKQFENFIPNPNEVERVKSFLSIAYPVKSTKILDKESKYIVVDDKLVYISGPLGVKSKMVNRLFLDVSDHFPNYSESSIRKAIKDFFDFYK